MNSKQVNETVNKLVSFMQDVKDGEKTGICGQFLRICRK